MNGLDPVGMAELREQLREIAATDRVAILVSSHLLHEVEQICQRVLFIRDSRLISETRLAAASSDALVSVLLVPGDVTATVTLLRQQAFVREVEAVRDGVACRLAPADVPELARLLVGAGIAIHAIAPRRGLLEELYLSQYADSDSKGIE
jgi:ABC-2 type transport system ATP-binding protein